MAVTGTLKVATPNDCAIELTRVFNAPRPLVWYTMTDPEALRRWLVGPPGWSMTVCENDLEVGGAVRWEWRGPDGQGIAMRGENLEVIPLERIVRTECFEPGCDAKGGHQIGTLILTDHDGRGGSGPGDRDDQTALALKLLYPSKSARDATIASGLGPRMAAAYERLDNLLAAIQAREGFHDAA
jgi:uncharacterized protein YndB with AHSA1/START domain